MNSDDREREDLRQEIERLTESQRRIVERLWRIEQHLGLAAAAQPTPPPPTPPLPLAPEPSAAPEEAPAPPAAHLTPKPVVETRLGLNWLNRIAAVTLVLAAAYFFKYAVDNDWIGEAGRIMLGLATGFVITGFAEAMWRKGQAVFAAGAAALGGGVLYLASYASWDFYHLLPAWAAFVLMVAVTFFVAALSSRQRSQVLAFLAIGAGYATPILLSTGENRPWVLFTYYLLLSAGALLLARRHTWRVLAWLAFVVPAAMFPAWAADDTDNLPGPAYLLGLLFQALFLLAYSRRMAQAALLWAPPLFGLAAWHGHWGFVPAAWASIALGLSVARRRALVYGGALALAGVTVGYWLWYDRAPFPKHIGELWLFLCVAFALFTGFVLYEIGLRRAPVTREQLGVIVASATAYFGASYHILHAPYKEWMGLFAALFGALEMGLAWWLLRSRRVEDVRPVLAFLGAGLCGLSLAIPIQLSGYSITMGWAIEAAALCWIGQRFHDRRPFYAAGAVYLLVLMRLAAFDAAAYGYRSAHAVLFNTRALTFLISAVSFAVGAYLAHKEWPRLQLGPALLYVLAHAIVLAMFLLELNDVARHADDYASARKALSVHVSVLFALYGAVLVAIGVLRRQVMDRILGLFCLAFVVLKVYFHDLWVLDRLFRVAVLAFTGALLLASSYFYSRYRNKIEAFWRADETADR